LWTTSRQVNGSVESDDTSYSFEPYRHQAGPNFRLVESSKFTVQPTLGSAWDMASTFGLATCLKPWNSRLLPPEKRRHVSECHCGRLTARQLLRCSKVQLRSELSASWSIVVLGRLCPYKSAPSAQRAYCSLPTICCRGRDGSKLDFYRLPLLPWAARQLPRGTV
jgi:hypothetical protein